MQVSKPLRHDQEMRVFSTRMDAGMVAMREWLYARRDEINVKWPAAEGTELRRLQGEAQLVARQIKLIEQGPAIKSIEGA